MKREWLQVLIDVQLKRQLKARAARNGENMTTVIEGLVQLYLSGDLDEPLAKNEAAAVTAA